MKRKTVTVGRCSSALKYPGWKPYPTGSTTTPMVRLRGRWLEREGFSEGRKYSVEPLLGTLSLTLAERSPRRDCSPGEAQALLAGVARRLREVKVLLEEIRDGLPRSAEEDQMLEPEVRWDLAAELHGTIEEVLHEGVGLAIEQLEAAATLDAEELERRWEERSADRSAARRLYDRIAPRVAEILDGDARQSRRRRR